MKYTEKVLPVMRGTREMLMKNWGAANVTHYKDETPWSVVTETDLAVEKYVASKLKEVFPEIVFVGEEQGGSRDATRLWLMDPIDGTAHYVRGTTLCTSMLALVEEGHVVFSAIYDFLNDQMYYAEKGHGAFCDETRLHVSSRPFVESIMALESRLEKEENRKVRDALAQKGRVANTMTAGWELMMTATGRLDARLTYNGYGCDYDYAAGTLLISEAGGIVANIGKKTYDYRDLNFIAANPVVYKELTEGPDAIFPLVA